MGQMDCNYKLKSVNKLYKNKEKKKKNLKKYINQIKKKQNILLKK